jgi:hypothetical protein
MDLEVDAQASLADVDGILRELWLECCGHLSEFRIGRRLYGSDESGSGSSFLDNASMAQVPAAVLQSNEKIIYQYDFGTTTRLEIRPIASRFSKASTAVRILVRNNPPPISCCSCTELATQVCANCWEESWFCDLHAASHDCGDEMFLPVVNSPRVGLCAYTGGSHTLEDHCITFTGQ